MTTYAYLRVSTDTQDAESQRHGVLEYANKRDLTGLVFVSETVSGRMAWKKRQLGHVVLNMLQDDDVLIVPELSRLARSTLQILEILEETSKKSVTVHAIKQNLVFRGEGDMTSRIMATVLGMVAQIERDLISARTTEALAAKKAAGVKLGRPAGSVNKRLRLDDKKEEIAGLIDKGVSKRAITKIVGCSPNTLYAWLYRNNLMKKAKS